MCKSGHQQCLNDIQPDSGRVQMEQYPATVWLFYVQSWPTKDPWIEEAANYYIQTKYELGLRCW